MTRTVREVYLKAVVARKFPEGPRGFWGLSPSVGYSFYFGLGDLFCNSRTYPSSFAMPKQLTPRAPKCKFSINVHEISRRLLQSVLKFVEETVSKPSKPAAHKLLACADAGVAGDQCRAQALAWPGAGFKAASLNGANSTFQDTSP